MKTNLNSFKNQIYGFALGNTGRLLYRLKNIDCCYLVYHNNLDMKYANAIGNSYCNQTSWQIMKLINQGKLTSQYTFFHVPKSIPFWSAAQELDQTLLEFKSDPR